MKVWIWDKKSVDLGQKKCDQTCARGTPHFSLHFATCRGESRISWSISVAFNVPEIHTLFAGNPHFFCRKSDVAWPGKDAVLGLTRLAPWAGQAWPGVRWPGWCWAAPSRDGPQSNPLEPISAGSSTALSRPTSPAPKNDRDLSGQKCFNYRGVLIGEKLMLDA